MWNSSITLEDYPLEEAMRELRDYMKSSPPTEGFPKGMLPGEPEWRKRQKRDRSGIVLADATWDAILGTAGSVGVRWQL